MVVVEAVCIPRSMIRYSEAKVELEEEEEEDMQVGRRRARDMILLVQATGRRICGEGLGSLAVEEEEDLEGHRIRSGDLEVGISYDDGNLRYENNERRGMNLRASA